MQQLRLDIQAVARCDAKVLIVGETGVGKEIVARLIHEDGARRGRPFRAINCAGLPDTLLESTLFGHVRGSFTDAYRDQQGLAAAADRGTLFLDELGEMSPRMQTVLLRFLETGEIHRVGSDSGELRVDVRVIAATNRNLAERMASGHFREDLYYRLNVAHISIPPLRDRGADVLELFRHYFVEYCAAQGIEAPPLEPATETLLLAHRWAGNVRELKNIAERLALRRPTASVGPALLPAELQSPVAPQIRASVDDIVAPRQGVSAAWHGMRSNGESFWTAVHAVYMDRGLTKADVREIVRKGLRESEGSYRRLIELFHLPARDYKRFLTFLYQHDCHVAFRPFRETTVPEPRPARVERRRYLSGAQ